MSAKHILIAEDEKPLAHALELKLTHAGYAVTVTVNGQECLDALKKSGYDAVLLDLMMPIMDGFQVLEKLHEAGDKHPPVIALSNLSQHEDEERVMALGAADYCIKSNTSLAEIVEKVQKL